MRNQHNVREHTRIRNGKKETVRQHTRGRDSGNNADNRTYYVPNKLFNAIAGGICLYLCAALGWSLITSAYTKIKGVKEKVEQVQEVAEYINSAKKGRNGEYEFDIKKELSIDAEDVKDILEKLTEQIETGNTVSEDVVIIDHSAVTDSKSYEKQIIKKLSKYKGSVTIVIIIPDIWSTDDASKEYERVKAIASDNIDLLSDTDFNGINAGATLNCPKSGNLMIHLTYLNQ